jgi:hypothetical protein
MTLATPRVDVTVPMNVKVRKFDHGGTDRHSAAQFLHDQVRESCIYVTRLT